MTKPIFPIDYNLIRKTFVQEIKKVTFLDENHVIAEENEIQNSPRPTRPYFSFKITGPGTKIGDDSHDNILGPSWNVGGIRKMTISFHCYGTSHEEAYNYMSLWQASLNAEPSLERLRINGIAVWMVGNVADLSQLLNTGYEGRAHLETTFGVASNLISDFGEIDHADIHGTINENIEILISE
jgi:hypothetical protein